jgi:hypothetical protein
MSTEMISGLAFVGLIGAALTSFASAPSWVGLVSAGLLLVAGVSAMAQGWFVGWTPPQPHPQQQPVPPTSEEDAPPQPHPQRQAVPPAQPQPEWPRQQPPQQQPYRPSY